MNKWPVFICYRQSDGMTAAARLFELLQDQVVPMPKEADPTVANPQLDVYFDQAAPGVEDWTAVHEPYLKRARAFIVICTPGSKLNEGSSDWVHREIDWWLNNRDMAPILVDPLGEGMRYVPSEIAEKWPNAQRIKLAEKEWDSLSEEDRISLNERIKAQFLGAIIPSGDNFYRQELEQEAERGRRLQRFRRAATALSLALLFALASAFWILSLKNDAEEATQTALNAKKQAEDARGQADMARIQTEAAHELAQTRVIEGQIARANTEARLLRLLQGFEKYKAYKPTLEEWEIEFRQRSAKLYATLTKRQLVCEDVGRFTVYEKQLIYAHLDGLPEKDDLMAYLAVVPGSSPVDRTPVVLDVFFGDKKKFKVGRDRSRATVKEMMKTVPFDDQWSILIGVGNAPVLTHAGRNYRIRGTNTRMNDEGDMVMAFSICVEIEPKS